MVSFSACASYSHVTHNLVAVVGPLSIGKRELSEGLDNRSKVNFVFYLLPWRCDLLPNHILRDSFATLPKSLEPLLNSGIVLAAVTAVLLNAYFNGVQSAGHAGAAA